MSEHTCIDCRRRSEDASFYVEAPEGGEFCLSCAEARERSGQEIPGYEPKPRVLQRKQTPKPRVVRRKKKGVKR